MAGRIPQHFIDDLLARVDIVDVVGDYVPLKKAGREFVACCPFHAEKTPSFTVSPQKQFYHCFGCGAHGTAIGFLMEHQHMDFVEAVEHLARRLGLEVPREGGGRAGGEREAHAGLLATLAEADRWFRRQLREHPQARRAVEYLRGRGVSGEIAARFGLGYAPPAWDGLLRALGRDETARARLKAAGLVAERGGGGLYDRFRNRIVFPIRDRRGRTVGFGGRLIEGDGPKYLNSPETPVFRKGRELYGLHEAREATRRLERLLVVEGYMDVIALAQHGITWAVATLGTAATSEHVERLFRTVPEVVFCFDGDAAGRRAAWRALEQALPAMRDGRSARFLFLPEGEDPDSLVRREGRDAFLARIENAVPFSEFFLEGLAERADTGSMDGRARMAELARPLLSKMPQGVLRELLTEALAERVGLPAERLAARLEGPAAPAAARPPARGAAPRGRATPVRTALALLLREPRLAPKAAPARRWLAELELPGVALLCQVLDLLENEPHLGTAAILERFRGTEAGSQLARLLAWDPQVPEEGAAAELEGALARLEARHREQRAERLLAKARSAGLDEAEKAELRALLGARSPGEGRAAALD